jgi:hypothetical protein
VISRRLKQQSEPVQAFWFGGVIIRKPLDPQPQHGLPRFAPAEVYQKAGASSPDFIRVRVDGREDIEQVLDIPILRGDPSRFSEFGRSGIENN